MGTKKEETAPDATGCLAKAADDEPIFILRAKDPLASIAVRIWAQLSDIAGLHHDKTDEAREQAHRMDVWKRKHDEG